MLVYHPGLLDAAINIANHDPIDEAREHAAIVLMNLVRHYTFHLNVHHCYANVLALLDLRLMRKKTR